MTTARQRDKIEAMSNFVRRNLQPSPVVRRSVLKHHRHNAFRSDPTIPVARAASRCPLSPRNDEDVAKISPPEHCPDFLGLHVHRPTSTLHHRQPSNQNRVHFQTAYSIGVQTVRPTKEPPGGHSQPNQEREKSSKFHSLLEKVVA